MASLPRAVNQYDIGDALIQRRRVYCVLSFQDECNDGVVMALRELCLHSSCDNLEEAR